MGGAGVAAPFTVVILSYSRNILAETELKFWGLRYLVIGRGGANLLHILTSFRPKTKAEKAKTFRIISI